MGLLLPLEEEERGTSLVVRWLRIHLQKKKKSTCQCRGHGFDPWSRKIPLIVERLSP